MAPRRRAHCSRCAHEVEVLDVWPGYVWAKRGWYVGLVLICALMPVILSEITLLLPLAMVFAAAAGPVHSLARERASCTECGAEMPAS